MAVLNNIRKRGIFLIVIIALALFSFVLADVIQQGGLSFGESQNVVGTINGKEINNLEFDNRVQNLRQNFPEGIPQTQITHQAWDATVKETLIAEQIEKSGIDIGSQQLSSALARQFGQNPEFSTNGQFDINKFKGFLEEMRAINPNMYYQWLQTEEQVVRQAKTETYFDLLEAGVGVTPAEAKQIYKLNNTLFDFEYVKIPFSSLEDDMVDITDADIKNYMDRHPDKFKTDGLRNIRYVIYEEKATPEDELEIKNELEALLEDYTSFNKAAGMEETEKGFKTTEDYEDFLSEHSDLPLEDSYVFKSDLPEEVADSIFQLEPGDFYGTYKDDGFWKFAKVIEESQMPDSVELKHIQIAYVDMTGQGINRTPEEAKQLADSLQGVIKSNPDKFKELAAEFSDDPETKDEDGDLGWIPFPKGEKSEFVDFAFFSDKGSVGVINTQYGYHVVYLKDLKNRQRVLKLATLAKEIHPSDQTLNELFNQATQFQMDAEKGDFVKVAEEHELEVRRAQNLEPLDEAIPGLGNRRNIVKWAFEENNKTGAITRFETDEGYVIAQVTGVTTSGMKSVEDAREEVKAILLNQKKGEYLQANISLTDLNDIASSYGVQVRSQQGVSLSNPNLDGNEPKVVGAAFGLKEGDLSQPIIGKTGVYVIRVTQKEEASEISSYNGIISQENQKNAMQTAQRILDALEDKAEIKEKLADFY